MAINSISTQFRLSGLGGSGLDTDSMVTQLMKVEKLPLDKLAQKKQLAEWKRDDYRSITNALRGFQDEFFNVAKLSSDMRSQSVYQKYTASSSDSSVVTATGSAGVTDLKHTISIDSLATASNGESTGAVTKTMAGGDVAAININDSNNSFMLNVNGVSKKITLTNGTYANAAAIVGNGSDGLLAQKVKEAFGSVNVVANGSKIEFTANSTDTITMTTDSSSTDNLMSALNVNSSGTGSNITFPLNITQGRKFTMSVVEGGVTTTKEIEWAGATVYNDSASLASDLQAMIDTAFTPGKVTVDGTGGKLSFTKGAGVDSLSLADSTKNNKVVAALGFTSGDSSKLSLNDTLAQVSSKLGGGAISFDGSGEFKLTINGKDITGKSTDTLSSFIDKVNNSEAGVTMSYSSFTDTFKITSKTTGAGTITMNDNGSGFVAGTKLTNINSGADASFKLDGLPATESTNAFNIDGVSYTLLKAAPGVDNTIGLTQDTDSIFNSIKSFVDKYNTMIDTINAKSDEKYSRDYQPLTSDQRASMSETDITKWETQAKTGLLHNDSILDKVVSDMRKALYDPINGIANGLTSIGITTGSYEDKGKLVIDENKLKSAISGSPDKVMSIFSKESSKSYSPNASAADRATRYSDNGIANRLNDILQDNIRTSRDSDNHKGILLEQAGQIGDISEFTNAIYKEIGEYDTKMNDLNSLMTDKENRYYAKFSAMEAAISKMKSQSSWLGTQSSAAG